MVVIMKLFEKREVMWLVLVLFVLLLAVLVSPLVNAGCFFEPNFVRGGIPQNHSGGCLDNVDLSQALLYCNNVQTCVSNYWSGQGCSNLPQCISQMGWCLDDCEPVSYPAACNLNQFLAQVWTSPPNHCKAGCCVAVNPTNYSEIECSYELNSFDCQDFASSLGFNVLKFDTAVMSSASACSTGSCPSISFKNVSGVVLDSSNNPLSGVTVFFGSYSNITNSSGGYSIDNVALGNIITVNHPNFFLFSAQWPGVSVFNISLSGVSQGFFEGVVVDSSTSLPLSSVLVTSSSLRVLTDSSGEFSLGPLSTGGFHSIGLSKSGFIPDPLVLYENLSSGLVDLGQLSLSPRPVPSGLLVNVVDASGSPVVALVSVKPVVGVTVVKQQTVNGFSLFSLPINKNYSVSVSASGFLPQSKTFNLSSVSASLSFNLVSDVADCPFPRNDSVEDLEAVPVRGQPKIKLFWSNPDCARDAVGYRIFRSVGLGSDLVGFLPGSGSRTSFEFVDDVSWGVNYVYAVEAVYASPLRFSLREEVSVSAGDARCEDRFGEFCLNNQRLFCDDDNLVVNAPITDELGRSEVSCSAFGPSFFCFGPDINSRTYCRDSHACVPSSALPFGLYHSSVLCLLYDSCYWDRSWSIFDGCFACNEVSSCFDYRSESACSENVCLKGSNECEWVDSLSSLDYGFCVEKDIQDSSHCWLCGDVLFRNNCSDVVCSALGECVAGSSGSDCDSCNVGDTCYDYSSQAACEGLHALEFNNFNLSHLSDDACHLGRCDWDYTNSVCIKDGDDDDVDDCLSGSVTCMGDNLPPVTSLSSQPALVNSGQPWLEFVAEPGAVLFYCFSDVPGYCPQQDNFGNDLVSNVSFDLNGRVSVDVSSDPGFAYLDNSSGTFFVNFFSRDRYNNLESRKSAQVIVDFEVPVIAFSYNLVLVPGNSTFNYSVSVSKPAYCYDRLKSLALPGGGPSFIREPNLDSSGLTAPIQEWRALKIRSLADGLYNYSIFCTDLSGNVVEEQALIVVSATPDIVLLSPPVVTSNLSLPFVVSTLSSGSCSLYELINNAQIKKEDLSADLSGKVHSSSSNYQFVADTLYLDYFVECQIANLTSKSLVFYVDRAPPETSVVFDSLFGYSPSFSGSGWSTSFNSNVTVLFDCYDPSPFGGKHSFGCFDDFGQQLTYFCLTNVSSSAACQPSTLWDSDLVLSSSVKLCYFSSDSGDHLFSNESVKCGLVNILPDFGLRLVSPEQFFYNNKAFGLVSQLHFDLNISSIASTDTCKWTRSPSTFNFFNVVNPELIFNRSNSNHHFIVNFSQLPGVSLGSNYENPFNFFIQCNSSHGDLGPFQEFNLVLDSNLPFITRLQGFPSPITESSRPFDLVVETDVPTRCKFDYASGSFNLMNFNFSGFSDRIFRKEHVFTYGSILQSWNNQRRIFNVSCQDGVGNISSVSTLAVDVDFSQAGAIISKQPSSFIRTTSPVINISTSQSGVCQYGLGTNPNIPFENNPSLFVHYSNPLSLSEGTYSYALSCIINQVFSITDSLTFSIDLTPPITREVDDGNLSCSLKKITLDIDVDDNLSGANFFQVELLDGSTVIYSENTSDSTPRVDGLDDLNLTIDDSYKFRVRSRDLVGNWESSFEESDGFLYVPGNDSRCRERNKPSIRVNLTSKSDHVSVRLICVDDVGCDNISYGLADSRPDCDGSSRLYSNFINVNRSLYVCYKAIDRSGNSATGSRLVSVSDSDGDGVLDGFDDCANTSLGKPVNNKGCPVDEDSDDDGLPDNWEFEHDDPPRCSFDPLQPDSDGDGVDDGDEDYDEDEVVNVDEFLLHLDPCEFGDLDSDGVADGRDRCPLTSVAEKALVDEDGCGPSQRDSDGDGLNDDFEERYCQGDCDPDSDLDGDGLTNLEEQSFGSNPLVRDTDDDGFDDKVETDLGFDPANSSSHPDRGNFWAWFLLVFGLLFLFGGSGYLVYSYFYLGRRPIQRTRPPAAPAGSSFRLQRPAPPVGAPRPPLRPQVSPVLERQRLLDQRRQARLAEKEAARRKLFEEFSSKKGVKSEGVGKVKVSKPVKVKEEVIEKPVFKRLSRLVDVYEGKKDKILPKLKPEEKNVFERLSSLSKSTGGFSKKKLSQLSSSKHKEVSEAFGKLSGLLKKRKSKKGDVFDELKKLSKK